MPLDYEVADYNTLHCKTCEFKAICYFPQEHQHNCPRCYTALIVDELI